MVQPGRPAHGSAGPAASPKPRSPQVDPSHVGGREDRGVGLDVFGRGGDYPGGGYGAEGYAAAYPDLRGDALLGDYGQDEQRARRRAADAREGSARGTPPLSYDGEVVVEASATFRAGMTKSSKAGKA